MKRTSRSSFWAKSAKSRISSSLKPPIKTVLIVLDDIDVYAFYGSYRGTYVLSFSIDAVGGSGAWLAISTFEVDDFQIGFNVEWLPDVWNNNAFYSLEEAYNTGLLTMGDLIKIKDIESELLPYR